MKTKITEEEWDEMISKILGPRVKSMCCRTLVRDPEIQGAYVSCLNWPVARVYWERMHWWADLCQEHLDKEIAESGPPDKKYDLAQEGQ